MDRDGVINRRRPRDYVKSWEEFEWLPGAVEGLATLGRWAPHVVVVTNQQGVHKGVVDAVALDQVHSRMQRVVQGAGGRLDEVMYCPHLVEEACVCRKPRPGLALSWLRRNPQVDGALSVMVGDSRSDIDMARQLALETGGCDAMYIGSSTSVPSFVSLVHLAGAVEELVAYWK